MRSSKILLLVVLGIAPTGAGAQGLSLGAGGAHLPPGLGTPGIGIGANLGGGAGIGAGIGLGAAGVSVGAGLSAGGGISGGLSAGGLGAGFEAGGSGVGISAGNASSATSAAGQGSGVGAAVSSLAPAGGPLVLPLALRPTGRAAAAGCDPTREARDPDRCRRYHTVVASLDGMGAVPTTPADVAVDRSPLRAIPGVPYDMVAACRAAIVSAAAPYDPVYATTASGGIPRRGRAGVVAPIETKLVYARQGGYEVRKAKVGCAIRNGRVASIT